MKQYIIVPLGDLLEKYNTEKLQMAFDNFKCEREQDLEIFIQRKAIDYERRGIGKTYLFIDADALNNEKFILMAYTTVAHTTIDISRLGKNKKKTVLGNYPGRDGLNSFSAFLIGQLGRSDTYTHVDLPGDILLNEAYHIISEASKIIGGNLLVLECREHMFEKFYSKHGFNKLYDELEDGLYTLYQRLNFQDYWKK